jgi:hypothetical protein
MRHRNIRAHIVSATQEKNRILRLAEQIGLNLQHHPDPRTNDLEDQITARLINKRVLSELLAGNQLSITNRYCPEIYGQYALALNSLVKWWVVRMAKDEVLKLDAKKLGIKNPRPLSAETLTYYETKETTF